VKVPYFLSILIAGVIFFLCIIQIPDDVPPEFQIPYFDKIVHLLMYLGLTGMLFIENFKKKNGYTWKNVFLFLSGKITEAETHPVSGKSIAFFSLLSLFYGGLIEIIQEYFSQFRTGDGWDFFADTIGVLIAIGILLLTQRIRINHPATKM